MDNNVIVIDDEPDFLESVRRGLITSGIKNVRTEEDPRRAAAIFAEGGSFDIALIDITMPGMNGIELLELIKNSSPQTECIMITALDEARTAVKCMRRGAYDYLVKPLSKEDLVLSVNRALERRRLVEILDLRKHRGMPKLKHPEVFKPIVTGSANVLRVLREAELHASSDIPILIFGETGTGKELLARAIHGASRRSRSRFTPVNVESLNPSLFSAEFFGHTKGAFTGANKDRAGYLESTDRGTLFLDEIGNLPLELQGSLLRVLQDGEFIKIGTNTPRRVDVRVVAATNSDLERLMAAGKFRKDLYYRLRGGWLHLPPLRKRKDDIPLLVGRFIEEFGGLAGSGGIVDEAMSLLMDYDYPGNIRELKSIVQSALNLAQGGPISPETLPAHLRGRKPVPKVVQRAESEPVVPLAEVEKDHIVTTYNRMGKNKSQTARVLGIGLNTLRRKLEDYSIS
jgi:two-component system response regulator AtoC